MKCPKCNFISFDYNQACPKCGHDLSHEIELMNLPAYTPKELSLLGLLTGNGDISSVDALIGPSEIPGTTDEDAEELLISLDSFSDEEQEPIQFEPEPSLSAVEPKIEEGATGADDGLTISLEDLSDEEHEPILLDSETVAVTPEMEIEDKVADGPTGLSEEREPDGLWEPDAIEQRMADMQLEDASKEDGATDVKAEGASAEGKEEASDLLELELEGLELDIEIEETDKKDA